jgi:hypothetical protein
MGGIILAQGGCVGQNAPMDFDARTSPLYKELLKREVMRLEPPPRFVVFVDMLGFSQLTEDHPDRTVYDFESTESYTATTSESAIRIGGFQYVLNSIESGDGLAPSHLMLFSDCAFLVFETALQAAQVAAALMRRFFYMEVPVRMGIAFGTWNAERFSFDTFNGMSVTRAVFFGTGVVRAHEAEQSKNSGRGLRAFVHATITGQDLKMIEDGRLLLPLGQGVTGPRELNYLHPDEDGDEAADRQDHRLMKTLMAMRKRVPEPAHPDVLEHYALTFAALDRMRAHWSRPLFSTRA